MLGPYLPSYLPTTYLPTYLLTTMYRRGAIALDALRAAAAAPNLARACGLADPGPGRLGECGIAHCTPLLSV